MPRLLRAAEASAKPFHGLSGPDRAALYLVAAVTGLRVGELRQLTRASFQEVPGLGMVVVAPAATTKNRQGARQVVPEPSAVLLRGFLVRQSAVQGDATEDSVRQFAVQKPLWPGWWHQHAARMLYADLEAAGIPVSTDEGVADFHALRNSYITWLHAAGVPGHVVQRLARHSDPRLTARYARPTGADAAAAVARLPSFTPTIPPKRQPKRLR